MFGELVPNGGGDPIPLLKTQLTVGRRESCDIVLRFGNVSGQHCELTLDRGWWFVKDLGSQNGTRVNGLKVSKKRLDPGDRLTIARMDYEVRYSPAANGGDELTPPEDDVFADIMGRSLLESAGLDRRKFQDRDGRVGARRRPAARPVIDPLGGDSPPEDGSAAEGSSDRAADDESGGDTSRERAAGPPDDGPA
ncbi:MAG: FHA domain-containing protein [Pirellulaceae bacterium]